MKDGRKKGACVSPLSTHGEPRGESTKTSPVRTNTPKQTLACQSGSLLSLSTLSAFFFSFFLLLPSSTTPHARNIFFLQTTVSDVFVFHYNTTRKRDERERGEEEEKRGALFKEPGGRNLCGCGRNTPPSFTSLAFFFFFFLLQRGSRGPHNHCLIITSMVVCRNAQEKLKKTGRGE